MVIFGNVVEIVCSFNLRFVHRDKVACARNVRIRTTAAAGSAREFGLKDCEIRVATMQSPSWHFDEFVSMISQFHKVSIDLLVSGAWSAIYREIQSL